MIVVDASAVVEWLMATPRGLLAREAIVAHGSALLAPSILDVEVAQVLRRAVRSGLLPAPRAWAALKTLADTPLQRVDPVDLMGRIWQLRDSLRSYDAAYVSLAEAFGVPLLTCDSGLANAPGHRAKVVLLP